MAASLNPAAPHHLPAFITAPGDTDVLMVAMGILLLVAVLMFGILFFRLHSLPERMAHRTHKLQFEIVAVLCLIALFTHMHIFWIAALLLALIDLPDIGGMSTCTDSETFPLEGLFVEGGFSGTHYRAVWQSSGELILDSRPEV